MLAEHCPQWADLEPQQLLTSGTDNAMWRLTPASGPGLVVRLPRTEGAAASLTKELGLLPALNGRLPVSVPTIAYAGPSSDAFPHPWAVVEWLDGSDCWSARDEIAGRQGIELAEDLAAAVTALRDVRDVDVPNRVPGMRGGPLLPLLEDLEGWLTEERWSAGALVDVAAVRRSAAESAESAAAEEVPDRFVHGDLIPGNVLVNHGRLSALIDWGGAGIGDAALDLTPAWAILDRHARETFREATGATDAAWLRGRAFALQQAVGGVLYYVPRRHVLGEVMTRTLARILDDA
ncbi:phosphotransferase [Knoellia subterranea KCTC 19937]|uniref:Phosphotransferase n=1 Tax=Knoellia subterranea KCTC 19937 TaxID=1385521 RepID=A0A0A0JTH9_9MICO|nr:phosphotransferase [Knoellia subterranea KCTC 19937]